MKALLMLVGLLLPWQLRRRLLQKQFGYTIHPSSRIGLALIAPRRLIMEEGSRIDHFTVCRNIDLLHVKAEASIGRANWITGFPLGPSAHFAAEIERRPQLVLEEHAAITHRHLIDCTNSVVVGRFTTVAGFRSQILTHSIDLERSRQTSAPIRIGAYCFIGTNCVLLPGSVLPDYCVVGAKSLLNKAFTEPYHLYAGVPAQPVKKLPPEWEYFRRTKGFVV